MPDPTTCVVAEHAELASATALTLLRRMRKLRRLQERCQVCDCAGQSAEVQAWRKSINTAVREIVEEWAIT